MSVDHFAISYESCTAQIANTTRLLGFAESELFATRIKKYKLLTQGDDVKQVYEINLSLQDIDYGFNVGDAIGIVPKNNPDEVHQILDKLNLLHVCDDTYTLTVNETSKKKISPAIPKVATLRILFSEYLEIRSVPKKTFLKVLSSYATNNEDIESLLALAHPKSTTYPAFMHSDGKSLLGILKKYASLQPPVEKLLEYMEPIKPRFYSISSAPEDAKLCITFSVIQLNEKFRGVCTGYLQDMLVNDKYLESDNVVKFYFRKPSNFLRFNDDEASKPLILIAPGTGVAPFVGLLQSRYANRVHIQFGETLLFFGCRYTDRDFIYKDEIHKFKDANVLSDFFVAASRETNEKIYVQDKIIENGVRVADLLVNQDAQIRLCGDANNLMKDVDNSLMEVLSEHSKMNREESQAFVDALKQQGKYTTDIWI